MKYYVYDIDLGIIKDESDCKATDNTIPIQYTSELKENIPYFIILHQYKTFDSLHSNDNITYSIIGMFNNLEQTNESCDIIANYCKLSRSYYKFTKEQKAKIQKDYGESNLYIDFGWGVQFVRLEVKETYYKNTKKFRVYDNI